MMRVAPILRWGERPRKRPSADEVNEIRWSEVLLLPPATEDPSVTFDRVKAEESPETRTWKEPSMRYDKDVEELLETCLRGDRDAIRECVDACLERIEPDELLVEMILPSIERIETLGREDRLTSSAMNVVLRSMRLAAGRLIERLDGGRRNDGPTLDILLYSGKDIAEELQGEIMAAVLETDGHRVRFAGGGVPADEILADVGRLDPDLLLLYASAAGDAPAIREVIDSIRGIGARPDMQIAIGGGVFARAAGLAEEIGADLWSDEPALLRRVIVEERDQRAFAEQRTVGRGRRSARAA